MQQLTSHVKCSIVTFFLLVLMGNSSFAQKRNAKKVSQPVPAVDLNEYFKPLVWRNIGPLRGGRSVAATGVIGNPLIYYMGTTGGGLWKTEDAGQSWKNISDGYFNTGSVGAVAVSSSDPNVIFVGMGEHAPRGVMTSYGDGVYRSTDAGKTWTHVGLELTRHISSIRIHPRDPDIVYVAAQGALYGPSKERGLYKSTDGGKTWNQILYVDENSGCADLSIDINNPRILYAAMWDHRRLPWAIQSGGKGSGLYKSTDAGHTWTRIEQGLPGELGKMAVAVSPANSDLVYALLESNTEKEKGGLFVSNDGGNNWRKVSGDHRLTTRAWYYIELAADPQDERTVYVLGAAGLKSDDGGKNWTEIRGTHMDFHQLWINPSNNKNMIVANDGGAAITFNGGKVWTSQDDLPTGQFYRINADNLFPYNIYAGQQDYSSIKIKSRNTSGGRITDKDWTSSAGGESAFLAFDPNNPRFVMGGSYQGTIELLDTHTSEGVGVMIHPVQYQALQPKNMKYRFNWNAPIIHSLHEKNVFYHAGNHLFKTTDMGKSWQVISPDLTTHDTSKMGISGYPYTNEGAGGENYCTISYVAESKLEKGVIYTGSDDGLVHITKDGGVNWTNITPTDLGEGLINAIEVSPHDPGTVFIAVNKYKFNDFAPIAYKSIDYGKTWTKIASGIPYGSFLRVVREDERRKGLLYAGTEKGLYLSYDAGEHWFAYQANLPVTPITDLKVHKDNLIASTQGRSIWVLDDLQPIRSFNGSSDLPVKLLPMSEVFRISGYSVFDGNRDPIQLRPYVTAANPSTGAVIYYQLPKDADSIKEIKLEIKDAQGAVVRSFSSIASKKKLLVDPALSDPLLTKFKGLNRFVWDLRRQDMPMIEDVYIEGSYTAGKVKPGMYTVLLYADTISVSTQFLLQPDPRTNFSADQYVLHDDFLKKLETDVADIHTAVVRMRNLTTQVKSISAIAEKDEAKDTIVKSSQQLLEKIKNWEEKLIQPKSQSYDDVINFVNKLSANIIFVHGESNTTIPYLTSGQLARYEELHAEWLVFKNEMNDIVKKDVAGLNALCKTLMVDHVLLLD